MTKTDVVSGQTEASTIYYKKTIRNSMTQVLQDQLKNRCPKIIIAFKPYLRVQSHRLSPNLHRGWQ